MAGGWMIRIALVSLLGSAQHTIDYDFKPTSCCAECKQSLSRWQAERMSFNDLSIIICRSRAFWNEYSHAVELNSGPQIITNNFIRSAERRSYTIIGIWHMNSKWWTQWNLLYTLLKCSAGTGIGSMAAAHPNLYKKPVLFYSLHENERQIEDGSQQNIFVCWWNDKQQHHLLVFFFYSYLFIFGFWVLQIHLHTRIKWPRSSGQLCSLYFVDYLLFVAAVEIHFCFRLGDAQRAIERDKSKWNC